MSFGGDSAHLTTLKIIAANRMTWNFTGLVFFPLSQNSSLSVFACFRSIRSRHFPPAMSGLFHRNTQFSLPPHPRFAKLPNFSACTFTSRNFFGVRTQLLGGRKFVHPRTLTVEFSKQSPRGPRRERASDAFHSGVGWRDNWNSEILGLVPELSLRRYPVNNSLNYLREKRYSPVGKRVLYVWLSFFFF